MITTEYVAKTFHFNPDNSSPLYSQLASYIKFQIQSGAFKPGDRMITETELCEILGVSRTTVRLSMDRLVEEGLIIRYRGKGSFIAEQKLRRNINYMYNFTENMRDAGAVPTSIVLLNTVMKADEKISEILGLPQDNAIVFQLRRVRCANDSPILLETSYIPYYLCTGIESTDFETASLYNVLSSQYALNLCHAEETIEAILIDRESADLLKCSKMIPGYKIERISYLDNGYVFEYTTSITRSDKCIFWLDLYRNSSNNKGSVDFERRLNP